MFKECYALEKIHGTSAHVSFNKSGDAFVVGFFSGGEKHERFVSLFDQEKLMAGFKDLGIPEDRLPVIVYGEAYGGSQQNMSDTYGKELKFVAFDVQIGEYWLDVPNAEQICHKLGIEFVPYVKVATELAALDLERDADSMQAIRNGVGPGKKREGVVLRPLVEVRLNNGNRVICKHKRDDFRETKTARKVVDPALMEVLSDANLVAEEWVTATRLDHVLDKLPGHCMERMGDIIKAMVEDVLREGSGEIVDSKPVRGAIGKKTAAMYKGRLQDSLKSKCPDCGKPTGDPGCCVFNDELNK